MRRKQQKAVFALTLLGAYALGLFSSTYDFHAHAHQVCPEHGEVLHGEESHAAQVTSEPGLQSEASSEHAHCALAPHFRPESVAAAGPSLHSDLALVPFASPTEAERPRQVAIPLYRLAPKNSPPA